MKAPVRYIMGGFPPQNLDWQKLIPEMGSAMAAIARYDSSLFFVPNPSLLLSPVSMQEAVLSSRIEGIQTTICEVLEFEARKKEPAVLDFNVCDIQEVLNYRKALGRAEEMMKELPLCQRIICEAHEILMQGVRGHGKTPGKLRQVANWIGRPGSTIATARYVPIEPEYLPQAFSHWERFIHEDFLDPLIQLALLHVEFEAIHPFLDGNGRLGRMIVPLFLFQKKIISRPTFYISAWLEKNRAEYYDRLLAVSAEENWTEWCLFFLKALKAQANDNRDKVERTFQLYVEMKEKFRALVRSRYASVALDYLFQKPIFRSTDFFQVTQIPKSTALRLLGILKKNNILEERILASGQQATIFQFNPLLEITEDYSSFE